MSFQLVTGLHHVSTTTNLDHSTHLLGVTNGGIQHFRVNDYQDNHHQHITYNIDGVARTDTHWEQNNHRNILTLVYNTVGVSV